MVHFSVTNIFKALKSRAKPSPPLPDKIWRDPLYFAAFGLGSGTIPIAPGTFGTLLAIPFYLLLQSLPLLIYLIFVMGFVIASSWISERVSREIHEHDHPLLIFQIDNE